MQRPRGGWARTAKCPHIESLAPRRRPRPQGWSSGGRGPRACCQGGGRTPPSEGYLAGARGKGIQPLDTPLASSRPPGAGRHRRMRVRSTRRARKRHAGGRWSRRGYDPSTRWQPTRGATPACKAIPACADLQAPCTIQNDEYPCSRGYSACTSIDRACTQCAGMLETPESRCINLVEVDTGRAPGGPLCTLGAPPDPGDALWETRSTSVPADVSHTPARAHHVGGVGINAAPRPRWALRHPRTCTAGTTGNRSVRNRRRRRRP